MNALIIDEREEIIAALSDRITRANEWLARYENNKGKFPPTHEQVASDWRRNRAEAISELEGMQRAF